jgi:hypothetical protein
VDAVPKDITGSLSASLVPGPCHGGTNIFLTDIKTVITIGSFDIKFHGKIAWLMNLLMKSLKGKITDAIKAAISTAFVNAAGTLNERFANATVQKEVGGGKSRFVIDSSFMGVNVAPDSTANAQSYMSFGMRMDVLSTSGQDKGARCSLPPQSILPDLSPGAASKDVAQIIIGQRFVDCIFQVISRQGG